MAKINLRKMYEDVIENSNRNTQRLEPIQPMTPVSGLVDISGYFDFYPRLPLATRRSNSFNRLVEFLNTLGFNNGNYIIVSGLHTSNDSIIS